MSPGLVDIVPNLLSGLMPLLTTGAIVLLAFSIFREI